MVATERGDFNDFPPLSHMHNLKPATDDTGAAENAANLFWGGVGGNVEIFRVSAKHKVAHRAPYHIGIETGIFQL